MTQAKRARDVEAKRARYIASPETKERDAQRRRDRQRERYRTDPEFKAKRIADAANTKRFKRRGITREIYRLMLVQQDFGCAGCQKKVDERTGFVDHDHATGQARGVLCHFCNISVHKHVTPEVLRRLADYLERT